MSEAKDMIKPPLKLKRVANQLFLCLVLSIAALMFTPWQQTVYGNGQVIAYSPSDRKQIISAPTNGFIKKWFVDEGTFVKKGEKIVQLKDQDPNLLSRLRAEKKALELNHEVAKQAANLALINVNRQEKLHKQGLSSKRKYELAKFEYVKYLSDIAKAAVAIQKVDVRIARQQSQLVTAPADGTIVRRLAGNQSVIIKEGDVLAELVPTTSSRAVQLWVNGNDVRLINKGDVAIMQFEGWPAVQLSGWPEFAINTFEAEVKIVDPAAATNGYFRLLLIPHGKRPWPNSKFLRQGVKVHGWIQLQRVPLWYEVWRQFNGFPPLQRKEES